MILVEDFDTGEVRTVDRAGPDHELILRVAQAFNRLLGTRGGISDFAANALRTLRGHGLEDTGASGYVAIDHGGAGWASVQAANTHQVRDGLIGQGIPAGDIDRFLEAMADPDTIVGSSVLISAWGRRPNGASGGVTRAEYLRNFARASAADPSVACLRAGRTASPSRSNLGGGPAPICRDSRA